MDQQTLNDSPDDGLRTISGACLIVFDVHGLSIRLRPRSAGFAQVTAHRPQRLTSAGPACFVRGCDVCYRLLI